MKKINWKKNILTNEFVSESCVFLEISEKRICILAGGFIFVVSPLGMEKIRVRDIKPAWLPQWPYPDKEDKHAILRKKSGQPAEYLADTYDFILEDNNHSGIITVGMHCDPICWSEFQNGQFGKSHMITENGVYESVLYTDLFGDGRKELITVPQKPYIAWYEPKENIYEPWEKNLIGEFGGDWHGLGCGDIDGDGQKEILTKEGVYKRNGNSRNDWFWIPIISIDENGNKNNGFGDVFKLEVSHSLSGEKFIFSSSPHGRGIWYWSILDISNEAIVVKRHVICQEFSQLHNMNIANYDNHILVITGKRKYAHGKFFDEDPDGEAVLLAIWLDNKKESKIEVIDYDSGAGINFDLKIVNDKIYIAAANKNGVYLFEGEKKC